MISMLLKVVWNVSIVVGIAAPLALVFLLITRKPQVEAWWEGVDAYSQFEEGEKRDALDNRLTNLIEEGGQDPVKLPKSDKPEDHFQNTTTSDEGRA